ncbi:MAG: hypothetical protein ACHQFX_21905 [Chitinophagales bacterium]
MKRIEKPLPGEYPSQGRYLFQNHPGNERNKKLPYLFPGYVGVI